MNYDAVCNLFTKQDCEDAAKIARLQLRPLRKMVSQTAFNSITLLRYYIYLLKKENIFRKHFDADLVSNMPQPFF